MRTVIAAFGVLVILALARWWWPVAETSEPRSHPPAQQQQPTTGPPAFLSPLQQSAEADDPAGANDRPDATEELPPGMDAAAIRSLRHHRDGDPRAPEIGIDSRIRAGSGDPPPADYRDYLSFQHEQQRRHHAAYVHAAAEKLRDIDEQLEWGRANGVAEPQLEAAREKRRRLAEARRRLLREDPALETDFPAPEPLSPPER